MTELQNKLEELKSFLIDDGYNDSNIVYKTLVDAQELAINYSQCCKSDSELLKHDNLTIGSQVEIDLTFTEKHIGKIVSIDREKVKVENNDWTYEVSKQNISKVF